MPSCSVKTIYRLLFTTRSNSSEMTIMTTDDDTKNDQSPLEVLFRSMQASRQSYEKDMLNSRPFQDGLRYLEGISADLLTAQTYIRLQSARFADEVYVGATSVRSIGAHFIAYRATGTIAVGLQWGLNSDMRRGDGAEVGLSFPFHCDIKVSLDDPLNMAFSENDYAVDVSSWRDGMAPDDDDF